MGPSSHDLAARDPAMAILMGAMAVAGADFGGAPVDFGNDYSTAYGQDYSAAYGFGLASAYDPSLNIGWGWGFGAPPAAPAAPHPLARHAPPPHPAVAAAAWAHHPANPSSTHSRSFLLDPNRDSTIKVQRYSFSFSPTANLVLGTASSLGTFTQNPSTSIKPQRVITNAPQPGFVTLTTLQIANVNVFVGGAEDAFAYSPLAVGVMLDLPRLDPQNRASASGSYSGVLPAGFTAGTSYQFIVQLQGPATLAGGLGQ